MKNFYTEQELATMPLGILRNLDVDDVSQEKLVQRVVNRRLSVLPPSSPIFRKDVPDIQNPEQEREWQAKIDARTRKLRPVNEDAPAVDAPPLSTPADDGLLDPSSPDFDPLKVDLAPKTGEGESVTMRGVGTVAQRIARAEKITEGKPITIGGGVSKNLQSKAKKK